MKVRLLLIALLIFIISCSSSGNFKKAEKKIKDIKSYSAEAVVIVHGNKGDAKYKVKQYYKDPDSVRIETLEPDFLKGKITIINGNLCTIYHPLINSKVQFNGPENAFDLIHIGMLKKIYDLGVKVEYTIANGKIRAMAPIPDGTKYRRYVVLYLDKKNYYPISMEILNEDKEVKVLMEYIEFNFNYKVDEKLFVPDF